jgi:hypothetical protein
MCGLANGIEQDKIIKIEKFEIVKINDIDICQFDSNDYQIPDVYFDYMRLGEHIVLPKRFDIVYEKYYHKFTVKGGEVSVPHISIKNDEYQFNTIRTKDDSYIVKNIFDKSDGITSFHLRKHDGSYQDYNGFYQNKSYIEIESLSRSSTEYKTMTEVENEELTEREIKRLEFEDFESGENIINCSIHYQYLIKFKICNLEPGDYTLEYKRVHFNKLFIRDDFEVKEFIHKISDVYNQRTLRSGVFRKMFDQL